ncbi:MAG: DUF2520 domain-containing protein [Pirellulales bacterium]|nr:DUF2520 domain-containing protein [Pirellulales bacterium]
MKTLNIIGCGKVGRTLASLWAAGGVFEVRSVLNRSLPSASRAVTFIGSGQAVEHYSQLGRADAVMISASDEAIDTCCRRLCRADVLAEGVVLFHCSGSQPSTLLHPARARGAAIAGVHPVKSFADPAEAVKTFAGTFCAVEGDPAACELLHDALHRCGGRTFCIAPESKTLYHAATVFVCNYLAALMEVGLRCLQRAGISREIAMELIEPIVTETVANVCRLGPAGALTGPIARGEPSVVQKQCEALGQWDENLRDLYRLLGQVAVDLSARQGHAPEDALAAIKQLLRLSPDL